MKPTSNSKSVRLSTKKHLENMEFMFKTLYKEEILTDVTLHCKDGSIKAHKLILASCSPYFRKVFIEHSADPYAVFIMHGIPFKQMEILLDLIYKGSTDIPSDIINSVYEVAEELQVTGLLVDENNAFENGKCNRYERDTRFKGQKRVAVDFQESEDKKDEKSPNKISKHNNLSDKSTAEKSPFNSSSESLLNTLLDKTPSSPVAMLNSEVEIKHHNVQNEIINNERFIGHEIDENVKKNLWALKQRKYKCDLCPSSFKRASHLTRHQLVHTGERPYACDQCDKAFSRHDKLKHHIKKAHELTSLLNAALPADSLYTIGHVQLLTPEQTMIEPSAPIVREDLLPRPTPPLRHSLPQLQPPKCKQPLNLSLSLPQKKGRGRPRKYPPVSPPLIKRPRGRPRLNPVQALPGPNNLPLRQENYDLTNMPYGDLEYLTKNIPNIHQGNNEMHMDEPAIMEPLVEIKTELVEKPEENPETTATENASSFLENIGLLENSTIGKIGECTISVANNPT